MNIPQGEVLVIREGIDKRFDSERRAVSVSRAAPAPIPWKQQEAISLSVIEGSQATTPDWAAIAATLGCTEREALNVAAYLLKRVLGI